MSQPANAVLRMPSRIEPREHLILDSVNADDRSPIGLDEIVTILSTGIIDGRESHLRRLFCDVAPGVILTFFQSRGVDAARLVSSYERMKVATGTRSEQFERHLVGQFVFTTV